MDIPYLKYFITSGIILFVMEYRFFDKIVNKFFFMTVKSDIIYRHYASSNAKSAYNDYIDERLRQHNMNSQWYN